MFNQIFSNKNMPHYISTDNDPLFQFHRWQANLRILEIEEVKSIPYTPISHPFIERLIGIIKQDYLNHIFFWNKYDLQNKLKLYEEYYNEQRAHSAINSTAPNCKYCC